MQLFGTSIPRPLHWQRSTMVRDVSVSGSGGIGETRQICRFLTGSSVVAPKVGWRHAVVGMGEAPTPLKQHADMAASQKYRLGLLALRRIPFNIWRDRLMVLGDDVP